jgi:hypothetical protein
MVESSGLTKGSAGFPLSKRMVRCMIAYVVWWSELLATDPEILVRFPALSNFLRSSGSGTGSTQHRGSKSSGSGLEIENTTIGIRLADHVGESLRKKLALTSPTISAVSIAPKTQRVHYRAERLEMVVHGKNEEAHLSR